MNLRFENFSLKIRCLLVSALFVGGCHYTKYLPVNEMPYDEIENECSTLKIGLSTEYGEDSDYGRILNLHIHVMNQDVEFINPSNIKILADDELIEKYSVYDGPKMNKFLIYDNSDITENIEDERHKISTYKIIYIFELERPIKEYDYFSISANQYLETKDSMCEIPELVFRNRSMKNWERNSGWDDFVTSDPVQDSQD
jgi:hypothetical protein